MVADVEAFCEKHRIARYVITSAKEGAGITELLSAMASCIRWDDMDATLTTDTFREIKSHVLAIKEKAEGAISSPSDLRRDIEARGPSIVSERELMTASGTSREIRLRANCCNGIWLKRKYRLLQLRIAQ